MRSTRSVSSEQEQFVANYLGGELTKNSGAGVWEKGDIELGDMIIECKTKMKPSETFSIKKEWIDKLRSECISTGHTEWSIIFDFGKIGDEFAIIPIDVLKDLLDTRTCYEHDLFNSGGEV